MSFYMHILQEYQRNSWQYFMVNSVNYSIKANILVNKDKLFNLRRFTSLSSFCNEGCQVITKIMSLRRFQTKTIRFCISPSLFQLTWLIEHNVLPLLLGYLSLLLPNQHVLRLAGHMTINGQSVMPTLYRNSLSCRCC